MIRNLFRRFRREPIVAANSATSGAQKNQAPGAPQTVSNQPNLAARTPEARCGIEPKKMKPEEIRAKLAELYKRHNAAAGSLNDELREEAEAMLDAIVACREKYVEKK